MREAICLSTGILIMMDTISFIRKRNELGFELSILEKEAELLRREQQHLSFKLGERGLTNWEMTRLEVIADEISSVSHQLRDLTSQFSSLS